MIETTKFDAVNKPTNSKKNELVNFLFTQLEEYGDAKKDITKAISYSVKEFASHGGFTLMLTND